MMHSFLLRLASLTVAFVLGGGTARSQTGGTNPPSSVTISGAGAVDLGGSVSMRVSVGASIDPATLTYIWRKDGLDLPGVTGTTYTIPAATAAHGGTYSVEAEDVGGWRTGTAELTVRPPAPPVITTQPRSIAVSVGQAAAFSYVANGSFPRTHQWRKDGAPISGATAGIYTITAAVAADAGGYSVVVTNDQGSVTSASATLTVNPAVAPTTATFNPTTQTAVAGEPVTLGLSLFGGSNPLTAQWSRNGATIPGATDFILRFPAVAESDAGTYRVELRNPAGSITSNDLVLTVRPATPLILSGPDSLTRAQGNDARFSVSRSAGSLPVQYQWAKNGVPLAGKTESSLDVRAVTFADAGNYSVTVTNGAGAVTSAPAVLTVKAAAAPSVRFYPSDLQVREGESGRFDILLAADPIDTGPLTYQWYKDGALLVSPAAGSFPAARPSDAGAYELKISGPGGTLSLSMKLVVLPPAPPRVSFFSVDPVRVGESVQLSTSNSGLGSGLAYQWFKDGVILPGSTQSSLGFSNLTVNDLATYKLVGSNDGGVAVQPSVTLRARLPGDRPRFGNTPEVDPAGWLEMGRVDNIVYALALSPHRIERYDLTAERWLASTTLAAPQAPTAFLATPQGIFIAYGGTLVRRPLDLGTESMIAATTVDITRLCAVGDWIYYNSISGTTPTMATVHRTTLQPGATTAANYADMAFSSRTNLGYGLGFGTNTFGTFNLGTNGAIASPTPTDSSNIHRSGSRLFLFPSEDFITSTGGTIFRTSDLRYVGSFGGVLTDVAVLANGQPIVLRNQQLDLVRAADFFRTGRVNLPFLGARVFALGNTAFVFGPADAVGGLFRVQKVPDTAFVPPAAIAVGLTAGERYTVEDAFLGNDGVVHLLSRSKQALIRWSATSRQFLAPVPLRGDPLRYTHVPGSGRALFSYGDGVVTEVPLGAGAVVERQIATVGNEVRSLADLGDMTLVTLFSASSSIVFRLGLGSQGEFKATSNDFSAPDGLAWLPGLRRFYSFASSSTFDSGTLQYETIPASGVLPSRGANNPRFPTTVRLPIRFNPEETLFVSGDGTIGNASLASIGLLFTSVNDAAWLPDALLTMRESAGDTEVLRWTRNNFQRTASLMLRGAPVRILRLSDTRAVVVTSIRGFITFTVLNADLAVAPPPALGGLEGVYLGQLGNGGGDIAFLLRPDRTGVMLAHRPPNAGLIAKDFTVEPDGTFVVLGRELTLDRSHAAGGAVSTDGTIIGTIAGWNAGFAASKTRGTSPLAGFYAAAMINALSAGGNGTAYAIVGADGRGLATVHNTTLVVGGIATINTASELIVTAADGTRLTTIVPPDGGRILATVTRGALADGTYLGLRDDVPASHRLLNISTRGRVGVGDDAMIAGFVISGSAPRTMLIRAIGPALASLGVTGALADSRLTLFQGGTRLAESDNWGLEASAAEITATAARVGAFALPPGGRDSALLVTLAPGGYTAQVSGVGDASGVALVEVYDVSALEPGAASARLVNIATRGQVGTGDDQLIAGLVVTGNAPKRVLIRAIGPGLGAFGVAGTLRDPVLTLRDSSGAIAANDEWSGGTVSSTTEVAFATAAVGAFPLALSSRDACMVITLRPGNYTAQVSGKGGTRGVALVEIYEVSN